MNIPTPARLINACQGVFRPTSCIQSASHHHPPDPCTYAASSQIRCHRPSATNSPFSRRRRLIFPPTRHTPIPDFAYLHFTRLDSYIYFTSAPFFYFDNSTRRSCPNSPPNPMPIVPAQPIYSLVFGLAFKQIDKC